jgi:hypothetical protein
VKKKRSSNPSSNDQHQSCTLDDLLKEVVEISSVSNRRRSKAQTKLEHALTAINQHAKVIDVLIQQQPDITALVWGAIRFLIGVGAREAVRLARTKLLGDVLTNFRDGLGGRERDRNDGENSWCSAGDH